MSEQIRQSGQGVNDDRRSMVRFPDSAVALRQEDAMKNFIKLTTLEILALAQFDPQTLPPLVCSAMGKLMKNYAAQVEEQNFIEALTGKGET